MNVRATQAIGVVAVVFTATLLWFSQIANAQPVTRHDLPVVRYAYFRAYDPTFIGIEKGFFKNAGVDVELTGNFPTGPSGVAAAGVGQVDAGLCAVTGLALGVNSGVAVHGVADIQTEFRNAPLERFYVKSDSSINSIKDLRGKKIGVNGLAGSFYYTWLVALQRAGIPTSAVQFVNMPFAQQEQALDSGQVDVIGMIDPYNRKVELDGGHRLLFRGVDILGSRHVSLLWFTDRLIKDKKVARAFIRGYVKSINWIHGNPRAAAQIMWKYIGVEPKYTIKHRYTAGAGVRMNDVKWWLRVLRGTGDLKDGGRLTPSDVVTQAFTGDPAKNAAKKK